LSQWFSGRRHFRHSVFFVVVVASGSVGFFFFRQTLGNGPIAAA
jgi:hypothetical protein